MSFGKADTDHNQPSFSQEPGCGFSPPSQEVGDSGQYQDPGHRPGELAPPNEPRSTETLSGPRPSHTNASLLTEDKKSGTQASVETRSLRWGVGGAGSPGGSPLEGAGVNLSQHPALRPAVPAGTSAVGASSVICWKPAEQIRFSHWPPRA